MAINMKYYKYEVIQDIGSGMNYYKKGLTKLIDLILDNQVQRLILTHKDRLLWCRISFFYM